MTGDSGDPILAQLQSKGHAGKSRTPLTRSPLCYDTQHAAQESSYRDPDLS